jgi:hypothetical protein
VQKIVELTEENLNENGIALEELLADGGYSSGGSFKIFAPKKHRCLYSNFGQYKPRARRVHFQ